MKKNCFNFRNNWTGWCIPEFLLKKNYIVHGIKRRSSSVNNYRIDDIYEKFYENSKNPRFYLHYGDVTDSLNISELVTKIGPDEIYNLAAQSHVKVSFETPEYTANERFEYPKIQFLGN